MKQFARLSILIMLFSLAFGSFAQDDSTTFVVTVENISGVALYDNVTVFNTPIDADEPGPAFPGSGYSVNFNAEAGQSLHFATMLVQTNDVFFAPDEAGIALFDMDGNAISGDVTDQVLLWDAGTEVNEAPGAGENQAPRQSAANTGDAENSVVLNINDVMDEYEYSAASDLISISLEAGDDNSFTLTINNIIAENSAFAGPFSPGVVVVTDAVAPLFTAGQPDYGQGLEGIAEDGSPVMLNSILTGAVEGAFGPLSPGAFLVTDSVAPLFTSNEADYGAGLEAIAEDGNPAILAESLMEMSAGVFNTPTGADEPGPAFPGSAYSFEFDAAPGENLHFATMYVQSNDIFFAPDEAGIAVFDAEGNPLNGNITGHIILWDAGTEVNEAPGAGENQAPRQSAANTGEAEEGVVLNINDVMDGYSYPAAAAMIRVTIQPAQ